MANVGLDSVRINLLKLSFTDAEVERSYRKSHAVRSRLPLRVLFVVMLVLVAVGAPLLYFDPFGSLDKWKPFLEAFWPRAGTSVLIFLVLVFGALGLTYVDKARDSQQLWAGLYMVLYTPLPLYAAEVMPLDFQRHLYPMMIVHVINIHLIIRLRFINATIIAFIVTALYVAYAGARLEIGGEEIRQQMMNLAMANVFGSFGSYQIELYSRREFLKTAQLAAERAKSEELLLNVLPAQIAERLKAGEETIADGVEDATILFADIVGFTELSERHAPDEVVDMLNEMFVAFDAIAETHGLEKIKTIGGAYMVAGGLFGETDHVQAIADMALDMMHFTNKMREAEQTTLRIRIGIHTGPVVAGVIGLKKFAYDLWGDSVNTAARMESHGVTDAIHVSAATHERLGDGYEFEARGMIAIKGKGEMETYLLTSKR